ncbi:helicase, partial [Aphelenchoides avenae]
GKAVKLESRFRITYGMLLNLLRVEQLRIEDMLQRSYVERSSLRLVVSRKEQITEIDTEIQSLPSLNCSTCFPSDTEKYKSIIAYHHALRAYLIEMASLWPELVTKHGVDKLFTPGRVLLITYPPLALVGRLAAVLKTKQNEAGHFTLTLLITSNKKERVDEEAQMKRYGALAEEEQRWVAESLVLEHAAVNGLEAVATPSAASNSYRVLDDVPLKYLLAICKQQLKSVDTSAILEDNRRRTATFRDFSPDRSVAKLIVELDSLAQKWSGEVQDAAWLYVLGQDIQKTEMGIYERIKWAKETRQELLDGQIYACHHCLNFVDHLKLLRRRIRLEETRDILSYQTSSEGLLLSKEYFDRLQVLRNLNYIDKNNMVELKGKVACEINHMELLITELILENKFENRSYAEIAALLSPLTCQFSRGKDECAEEKPVKVPAHTINELKMDLVEVALRIDAVQQSCGVTGTLIMDELKFGLMEAVHEWANGVPFAEIMQLTEAQEGLIVRCIQRLDEVCKDVRNAARIIGDPELFEKMEETSASIRRDIVFAASLYTTE